MDYSRWDKVGEDSEEEEEDAAEVLGPVQQQKQVADELFDAAERTGARDDYSAALDRYEDLLPLVLQASREGGDNTELSFTAKRLEFSCSLNAATCFLRLEEWPRVVDRVSSALAVIESEEQRTRLQIGLDKVLRARQLKVLASLQLGGTDGVRQAQREAELMRQALRKPCSGPLDRVDSARREEYNQVFDAVLQRCTAIGADIVSKANALATETGEGEGEGEAWGLLKTASEMVRAGEHSKALTTLDAALTRAQGSAVLLSQLWLGRAQACEGLRDLEGSAEAHAVCAQHCPPSEAGSYLLKAAATLLRLRSFDRALQLYRSAHAACSPPASAQPAPATATATLPESAAGTQHDLVKTLALAGEGTCLLRLQRHEESLPALREAAQDLGRRLDQMLVATPAPTPAAPALPDALLFSLVSTMQHLWNALDGLTDACTHLEQYPEAGRATERALLACDAVLLLGGYDVTKREASTPISSGSGSVGILRKRRACTLLSRGHLVCLEAQARRQELADQHRLAGTTEWTPDLALNPAHMTTASSYWSLAAEELSRLGDHRQAMTACKNIAAMWSDAAGVEAFAFEAAVDLEAAEAGHDAWRAVAQHALRVCDDLKARLPLDFRGSIVCGERGQQQQQHQKGKENDDGEGEKEGGEEEEEEEERETGTLRQYHAMLEEALGALYSAGLCAVYIDDNAAIRALEAAQHVQRDLEAVVPQLRPSEQQRFAALLQSGDLAYYCAHCSLKLGDSAAALAQLVRAGDCYSLCEDRRRRKLVLGLQSLAHAAAGNQAQAHEAIAQLRGLCLLPLEDPDREVQALQDVVYRRFRKTVPPAAMAPYSPSLRQRAAKFLRLLYLESVKDTQAMVQSAGLVGMFLAGLIVFLGKWHGYSWTSR